MTVNNAENGINQALVNELRQLRRDLDEMKSTPQPIGNGSLNYATFTPFSLGAFTIPAGLTANIGILFMDDSLLFTYDGKEAINRRTLLEPIYSVCVDVNDTDHAVPYGPALTSNQRAMRSSWWCDYHRSGLSETSGERYINIQVTNYDSGTHDYYVNGTALIPRPALKPQ